jgi:hypothetical protein
VAVGNGLQRTPPGASMETYEAPTQSATTNIQIPSTFANCVKQMESLCSFFCIRRERDL